MSKCIILCIEGKNICLPSQHPTDNRYLLHIIHTYIYILQFLYYKSILRLLLCHSSIFFLRSQYTCVDFMRKHTLFIVKILWTYYCVENFLRDPITFIPCRIKQQCRIQYNIRIHIVIPVLKIAQKYNNNNIIYINIYINVDDEARNRHEVLYGRTSANTGHEIFYFSGFIFGRSIPAVNRLAFLSPVVGTYI